MLRLMTDQELRGRIIPAARERIRQEFDNQVLTKKLAEIYSREIKEFGNLGIE